MKDGRLSGFGWIYTISVNVCCGFIICVWGVSLAVFLPFSATMECNMCASMRWRIKCNMGSVSIVNFAMAIVVLGQIAGAVVDYGGPGVFVREYGANYPARRG